MSEKHTPYGITERKKQELDSLTQKVLNAQNEVDQLEAIVDSLTTKSQKLSTELSAAEANKSLALTNKDLVDSVVDSINDLENNSGIIYKEVKVADKEIQGVALEINEVINKLIFSAEIVNKLSNLVIRKKAINPLISDELITLVTNAGTDANNAVALTLTALESVFASQATTSKSKATSFLELSQVKKLQKLLTAKGKAAIKGDDDTKKYPISIQGSLYEAYDITLVIYNNTLIASNDTLKQLNNAKATLSQAQIKLNSLQSGLAAANAAALAA
jgi:hypothetical protein